MDKHLIALLDRMWTAGPRERWTCGHLYAEKQIEHGQQLIHVWCHESTSEFRPRCIDTQTVGEILTLTEKPETEIEEFRGTLADYSVNIEGENDE